jgi:phage tail protein X
MKGPQLFVPRTCRRHVATQEGEVEPPIALAEAREFSAYVLLGDPGSGKTQAFEQEAAASGGRRISAGDFIALDYPELQDMEAPVFIDGLDESRAGTDDGRVPLDEIRKKLKQLRCKRWRISCRAADWLGATDAARLQAILPPGATVQALTLQPLALEDVAAILQANHGIADPQAFIDMAQQHGLTDLLFNPQTLEMLAKAVGPDNHWPGNRLEVYEMACARLVQEHNVEHLAATRKIAPDQVRLRRAAAYLCAIQLVADAAGFTRSQNLPERVVALNAIPNPDALPLDEALACRLFKEVGRDVFAPVHRTVAEFLAAGYLAEGLKNKLTLRRVLAQICGADGGIVSGMRGLGGWLASLSTDARPTLSRLDPLGVLLYGDASTFSMAEKVAVLDRLGEAIASSPSFRWHDWDGRPFPALVTPDMRAIALERLASSDRSDEHQIAALTLLEGFRHTAPDATLAPALIAMARDATRWQSVRLRALKVYLRWAGSNDADVRTLLNDIDAGTVADSDDEILGALLAAMYPEALPSSDLPRFLHPPKKQNLIGKYTMFWRHDLARVDAAELPGLLDAFAQRPELRRAEATRDYAKAVGGALSRALNEVADSIPNDRLLTWLDACCGKHAQSLLENDDEQAVRRWLEARPQRYFGLLDLALERFWSDKARAWPATARMHGARTPSTAPTWWLTKAEVTADETRAKEYFVQAVRAIPHEPGPELDALLTACEHVALLRNWQETLTALLTCDFEQYGWKFEEAARSKKRAQEAAERGAWFRERLAAFDLPEAPRDVLDPVVLAHEHHYYDIDGDTPEERLDVLFAGDEELVAAAFRMLRNATMRTDLPGIQEILDDAAKGQVSHLTLAMLIGLDLRHRDEPEFLDGLSEEHLTAALVAHLAYTREDHGAWVDAVVRSRQQCMADALSAYLAAAMRWKERSPNATHLFRQQEYGEVARRCLLPLLAQFPIRSHPSQRGALSDMLHAALNLPPSDELLALVKDRVNAPRMDGPQRARPGWPPDCCWIPTTTCRSRPVTCANVRRRWTRSRVSCTTGARTETQRTRLRPTYWAS